MRRSALAVLLLAAIAFPFGAAIGDVYVETFTDGVNQGGWTYFRPTERIESEGGNPGAWLHVDDLDTFAPQPSTTGASVFTGDFRTNGVAQITIDLITLAVDFSAEGRALTLMLVSDNDTPGDPADDWAAYLLGRNIPLPGEGWISYTFEVPSGSTELPFGWSIILLGPNSPPTPDWNDLITDVDRVAFSYGDPTLFYIFQVWNVGMDNPSITFGVPSAASITTIGAARARFR